MNSNIEIIVSGRPYKVPSDVVPYDEIVEIWNEIHKSEGTYILGTPGIDYENDYKGEDGILYPGEKVTVHDGTIFTVDPQHVS